MDPTRATRVTLLGLAAVAAACTGRAPPPESNRSGIGYASVAEALAALRAKPGAEVGEQDGWTIIQDAESETSIALWSFAPANDPAHPSAVKRVVSEQDGSVQIEMRVLCEATKAACDQLVRDFQALNDQMKHNGVEPTPEHAQ
jgi:hypothetical protein